MDALQRSHTSPERRSVSTRRSSPTTATTWRSSPSSRSTTTSPEKTSGVHVDGAGPQRLGAPVELFPGAKIRVAEGTSIEIDPDAFEA